MKEFKRSRRLRKNKTVRDMIAETSLELSDLIYPMFVVEGEGVKEEIPSMRGVYRFSVDTLLDEVAELLDLNLNAIMLFGIPAHKDEIGSESFSENGIIQKAIRAIKEKYPQMYIITDVCMCEYTNHGHCGIIDETGYVVNDTTLEYLAKISISHVKAGADMVAPSDMMDGRIGFIREKLDEAGFENIPIMAYSAKYSSNFYGPFRDAADSTPAFGDRKTYQMDYRNSNEAMVEIEEDILEGADIVMVKPALPFLDIIRRARDNFDVPLAAYNVSGEYAMIRNAVDQGLLSEDAIEESLISIKRAGAKMILTYFAKDIAKKRLKDETR